MVMGCVSQSIKTLRDELSRCKAEHRAEFENKLGYACSRMRVARPVQFWNDAFVRVVAVLQLLGCGGFCFMVVCRGCCPRWVHVTWPPTLNLIWLFAVGGLGYLPGLWVGGRAIAVRAPCVVASASCTVVVVLTGRN